MIQAMKDPAGDIERSIGEPSPPAGRMAAGPRERIGNPVYDRNVIARLSCVEIEHMSCAELIRAIRESRALVLRPEASRRLEYFERRTLEQLVHILQRSFQEQNARASCLSVIDETPQRRQS